MEQYALHPEIPLPESSWMVDMLRSNTNDYHIME